MRYGKRIGKMNNNYTIELDWDMNVWLDGDSNV